MYPSFSILFPVERGCLQRSLTGRYARTDSSILSVSFISRIRQHCCNSCLLPSPSAFPPLLNRCLRCRCHDSQHQQDLTFDFHNNGIYLTKPPISAPKRSTAKSAATSTTNGKPTTADEHEVERSDKDDDGDKDKVKAEASARGADEKIDHEDVLSAPKFINPHDRNGKLLSKRFTTKRVR